MRREGKVEGPVSERNPIGVHLSFRKSERFVVRRERSRRIVCPFKKAGKCSNLSSRDFLDYCQSDGIFTAIPIFPLFKTMAY